MVGATTRHTTKETHHAVHTYIHTHAHVHIIRKNTYVRPRRRSMQNAVSKRTTNEEVGFDASIAVVPRISRSLKFYEKFNSIYLFFT